MRTWGGQSEGVDVVLGHGDEALERALLLPLLGELALAFVNVLTDALVLALDLVDLLKDRFHG